MKVEWYPIPHLQSLYLQAVCGVLILFPFYLLSPASPITLDNLPIVLYAGVVASAIAPFLWMLGVENLGPNRASSFMNLLPVLTSVFAIFILKESIQSYHIVGGVVTLLGVVIVQKSLAPKTAAQ